MPILRPAITMLFLLGLTSFASPGRQSTSVSRLFERLKSEDTTTEAMEEFVSLGPDNTEVRGYLAVHLPPLIGQEPKDHPHSWVSEVRLAGTFRITDAIPSLTKRIGQFVGTPAGSTLAEQV